jgi:hypothetical protein
MAANLRAFLASSQGEGELSASCFSSLHFTSYLLQLSATSWLTNSKGCGPVIPSFLLLVRFVLACFILFPHLHCMHPIVYRNTKRVFYLPSTQQCLTSITNTAIQPGHHMPDYKLNVVHTLIQSIASISYMRTEAIYTQHNDRQNTASTHYCTKLQRRNVNHPRRKNTSM